MSVSTHEQNIADAECLPMVVHLLDDPQTVACDPVLPGFALDLREIW